MGNRELLEAKGIILGSIRDTGKTTCPTCSELRKPEHRKDKCLSVNVAEGVFNCHNCGFAGKVGEYAPVKEVQYAVPTYNNQTDIPNTVVHWFFKRGISQKTLTKMQISYGKEWIPKDEAIVGAIQFPYFRDGQIVNIKYRSSSKGFKMFKDAQLIPFNLDGIKDSQEVIWVEGEMDQLSFVEAGIDYAISVPNGASRGNQNLEYLDNSWDCFENIKRHYICTDNDEAGFKLRDELIRRLGIERCLQINLIDCKDANEFLQKYGPEALRQAKENAEYFPISGIIRVPQLKEEVEHFYRFGLPQGRKTGMREFDDHISFVSGQLTGITGIPNQGKSSFLDQILSLLSINHGWKTGIFSPENFPVALHLTKLAETILGLPFYSHGRMQLNDVQNLMDYLSDRFFWISPEDEDFSLDNILSKGKQLVRQKGINALVIDPWNKLEHTQPSGISETNFISKELDKIIRFNQTNGVHGFLVAHPTKVQKNKDGSYEVPNLYSISGSANFFNKIDNGMCVYRNFTTGRTEVHVQKVKYKHLGKLGLIEFTFDPRINRFLPIDQNMAGAWNALKPEQAEAEIVKLTPPKEPKPHNEYLF